jgi:acyl-CoA synthetase (AMP-forming)/AMP-acid ligase II
MYEAHFGVPMSGAVLNNINTRLDARTVFVLLRHSGSKLILVDPALLPILDQALRLLPPGHPAPRVVLVEDRGLDARTVSVLLCHSGSKLILIELALLPILDEALRLLPPGHPTSRVVLVEDPHEKEFPPAPAAALTYERLLEMGDPEFKWVRPASEWDPMILNYTSSTTSAPKGVVRCRRSPVSLLN